jgi:hypothetical protein
MKNSIVLTVLFLLMVVLAQSCKQNNSASPDPAPTNTPISTATPAPTLSAQSHFYTFETGTDGWVNGSTFYAGFDGLGLSVAQNTNALYCDGGSSGSLQLNVNFGLTNNFYAVAAINYGTAQNMAYRTLSARVYIPAGFATSTNPVTAIIATWDGISAGSSGVGYTTITSSGWITLQGNTNWMDSSSFMNVKQLQIKFSKPSGCQITYSGPIYIDNVAW